MKKIGYLTFAALLAFGSCTNEINEEGFVDKANTISFSAYSNKTRAYSIGDIDNATAMQDGYFGVVGYKSGNSIYLGSTTSAISQSFNSETNHWEYTNQNDLKYWPDGTMDFYAYFPYASSGDTFAESTSDDGTVMTINNATGNQDVLFASALNKSYQECDQERVSLTFHHAFSKINSVNIKVELNDVDVVVNKVEFINTQSTENSQVLVDNRGKAKYGTSTGSSCGTTLDAAVTISTTSNSSGYTVWSSSNNKYILATNGNETNNVTGTNKVMWDGTKTGWANDDKLSTKGLVCLKITGKVKTHNGENYIIGNASENGVIYIPLKGTHASVGSGDDISDIDSFFAGKRYTYNIVMKNNVGFKDNGDPILKPILFDVSSVTGWDDVTVTINL